MIFNTLCLWSFFFGLIINVFERSSSTLLGIKKVNCLLLVDHIGVNGGLNL